MIGSWENIREGEIQSEILMVGSRYPETLTAEMPNSISVLVHISF